MAGRELYAKLALRVERKANMNKNSLYDAIDEHFTQNECSTPTVHSSLAPRLVCITAMISNQNLLKYFSLLMRTFLSGAFVSLRFDIYDFYLLRKKQQQRQQQQ